MDGRTENLLATTALALAERVQNAGEDATGLSAGAPAALVALSGWLSGQSVNSLAQVLGLSHAGAVRLVDRLQADGLIERRRGDGDAREVSLVATRAGRAAAKRVLAQREAAMADALDIFAPPERAQLTTLLERLLAELSGGSHATARHMCRLCDVDACGHPDTCPVTIATQSLRRPAPRDHVHQHPAGGVERARPRPPRRPRGPRPSGAPRRRRSPSPPPAT